jgi:chromosome segregation ATPase
MMDLKKLLDREMLQKIAVYAVVVILGIALGYTAGFMQLLGERKEHNERVNEANKKISLLQKRYSEEKASETTLQGEKRALQAELEKVKAEATTLAQENAKNEGKARALESKERELTDRVTKLEAFREDLQKKHADLTKKSREQDQSIKQLTGEKQSLQAELRGLNQNLEVCTAHNGKLAVISTELVDAYANKGVGKALLQKEPLTQMHKVEMEKLVQEYRDKIDSEKFKKR